MAETPAMVKARLKKRRGPGTGVEPRQGRAQGSCDRFRAESESDLAIVFSARAQGSVFFFQPVEFGLF
ncbi:MAG: hypothetical protein J0H30_03970, partial [Alphaproteobacteria bacterium]|nr:hypothetical protein [Alphaproteobacteria bacterium]